MNFLTNRDPTTLSDEIDLSFIKGSLIRKRKIIIIFTFLSVLFSVIYSLSKPRTYQGQFQIVLKLDEGKSIGGRQNFSNLISGTSEDLATEIQILKSQSVLQPIYEKFKYTKTTLGKKVGLNYQEWAEEKVGVQLELGTSVLNVSFRDQSKEIVLDTLESISSTYKKYSKRAKEKSLINRLSFLKEQISIYDDRSKKSNKTLDAYQLKYGIKGNASNFRNGLNSSAFPGSQLQIPVNSDSLNESITKTSGPTKDDIARIDQDLLNLRTKYTDKAPIIQETLLKRKLFKRYLDLTAGGIISLSEEERLTKKQAQDVVIKYKEIKRTAERDSSTLESLETKLLNTKLNLASLNERWELISTPTLLEYPVAPRRKRIVSLTFFASLLFSSGLGLFLDRKDDIIFNQNEIEKKINSNFVSFSFSDLDNIFDNLNFIIKNNLYNSKSLAIISCTDLTEIDDKLYKGNRIKELKKYVSEIDLFNYKNMNSFSNSEAILLIFKLGNTKRSDFNSLMDKLKILKDKEIYNIILS